MPRRPIGQQALTNAERQARHRAARASSSPAAAPKHRSLDTRSRNRRWNDTVAEIVALQAEYAAWLETMPENLQDSATAEALREICDIDLTDLQVVRTPKGFGRD